MYLNIVHLKCFFQVHGTLLWGSCWLPSRPRLVGKQKGQQTHVESQTQSDSLFLNNFYNLLIRRLEDIFYMTDTVQVEMWEVKLKVVSVCVYITLLISAVLWHLVTVFTLLFSHFNKARCLLDAVETPLSVLHIHTLFDWIASGSIAIRITSTNRNEAFWRQPMRGLEFW